MTGSDRREGEVKHVQASSMADDQGIWIVDRLKDQPYRQQVYSGNVPI